MVAEDRAIGEDDAWLGWAEGHADEGKEAGKERAIEVRKNAPNLDCSRGGIDAVIGEIEFPFVGEVLLIFELGEDRLFSDARFIDDSVGAHQGAEGEGVAGIDGEVDVNWGDLFDGDEGGGVGGGVADEVTDIDLVGTEEAIERGGEGGVIEV